jgi:predicted nucleotidyltransferase/DNA-binding transcriptional ArsR family regulator
MFENSQIVHLAVGRSIVRQRILALLLAEPGPRLHLRDIQRRASTSPGTASRELAKLVAAGLIERETEANQVYFRGSASPFATMLRSLLVSAATPPLASGGSQGDATAPTSPPHVAATPASIPTIATQVDAATVPAAQQATSTASAPGLRPNQDEGTLEPAAGPITDAPAPGAIGPGADMPPAKRVTISGGGRPGVKADPLGLEAGAAVAARMRAIYGARLRGVFLYGQRAAGGAPEDSDVELLVVLDRIERYGEELDRTGTVFASLSLELGVVVSRVFVSEADWRDRTDGGLPGVQAEAVPL